MNAPDTVSTQTWTEARLEALAEDGFLHEVVDGELVMSPKNTWYHGRICTRLLFALEAFNRARRLGAVLDSSTGFWMFNRNCRAPDISFVARSRMETLGFSPNERRFFPGAPDLAVEVLTENSVRSELDRRLKDFFGSGTRLAWVIDAEQRRVEVCRGLDRRELVGSGGCLEGDPVLPEFSFPVSDLFKEWDWE
jgi:Uma2 family endonuclease